MINILMTTYNGEKYVKEQINSILEQSYTDWKLYIFDDISKDSTFKILTEFSTQYPEKIIVAQNSISTGNARDNFLSSLNKIAESEYTMFCDQDDVWMKDKVKKSIEAINNAEKIYGDLPILVHTDLEVVNEKMELINPSFLKLSKLDGHESSLSSLLVTNNVTGCTILMNQNCTSLLKSLTSENHKNIIMHDHFSAIIASALGKIVFLDEPTIRYRQHGNNQVGAKNVGLGYYLKKINKIEESQIELRKSSKQALVFLTEYEDLLSDEVVHLLKSYESLYKMNRYTRNKIIKQHNFYSQGLLRTKIKWLAMITMRGEI